MPYEILAFILAGGVVYYSLQTGRRTPPLPELQTLQADAVRVVEKLVIDYEGNLEQILKHHASYLTPYQRRILLDEISRRFE